ncbi:hypothetical protein [Ferrimonas kyonanensis]|uniref:hypothetical protein n=1 Tax=Ferrimonas kyonanensis TaxID=364763 RepID=UPI0004227599|nr:hypothetical protein [Ferrimonas kyonanensis]
MDETFIKELIAADAKATADNQEKYPDLAPEECCPHKSAESVYIGDGDTEHSCRYCGWSWITTNPKHLE